VNFSGRLRYFDRGGDVAEGASDKPKRTPKPGVRNNPKHIACVRELRDRYLEQINAVGSAQPAGKYDVGRGLESTPNPMPVTVEEHKSMRALPAG
jgi:hypothetical protein